MIACLSDGVEDNLTIVCTHHGIYAPNSTEICGSGTGPVIVSGVLLSTCMVLLFYELSNQIQFVKPFYVGRAASNVIIIAVVSSFAGVFLISLLFFIIASICCWCKRNQKQGTPDEPIHATNVIYEEILPRSQQEELELNQNVAYGTIRPHMS